MLAATASAGGGREAEQLCLEGGGGVIVDASIMGVGNQESNSILGDYKYTWKIYLNGYPNFI